jgi:hypothetical protein
MAAVKYDKIVGIFQGMPVSNLAREIEELSENGRFS